MKKIKLFFGLILLLSLILVVFQNKSFFINEYSMFVNLHWKSYQLPAMANGLYLLGCFLIGFLIASFRGLFSRFKANKTVNELHMTLKSQKEQIVSLKSEVEFLQRNSVKPKPAPKPEPQPEKPSEPEEQTKPASLEETVVQE